MWARDLTGYRSTRWDPCLAVGILAFVRLIRGKCNGMAPQPSVFRTNIQGQGWASAACAMADGSRPGCLLVVWLWVCALTLREGGEGGGRTCASFHASFLPWLFSSAAAASSSLLCDRAQCHEPRGRCRRPSRPILSSVGRRKRKVHSRPGIKNS